MSLVDLSLVDLLRQEQERLGMDSATFAAHVGISEAAWSRAKSGQIGIGLANLRSIVNSLPRERRPAILRAAGLDVDTDQSAAT